MGQDQSHPTPSTTDIPERVIVHQSPVVMKARLVEAMHQAELSVLGTTAVAYIEKFRKDAEPYLLQMKTHAGVQIADWIAELFGSDQSPEAMLRGKFPAIGGEAINATVNGIPDSAYEHMTDAQITTIANNYKPLLTQFKSTLAEKLAKVKQAASTIDSLSGLIPSMDPQFDVLKGLAEGVQTAGKVAGFILTYGVYFVIGIGGLWLVGTLE